MVNEYKTMGNQYTLVNELVNIQNQLVNIINIGTLIYIDTNTKHNVEN